MALEKTILFGANGSLAARIMKRFQGVRGYTKQECDITDKVKVISIVEKEKPVYVINCAAMTDVDLCDIKVDECWRVNVQGVKNIAEACNMFGAKLIHFSSDYAVDPVNEYGWSKLASEAIVGQKGLVLRTNLYDETSFILRNLSAGKYVGAYYDVFFNPISKIGITDYLFLDKTGIINIGTNRRISMYDFAMKVCQIFNLDTDLVGPKPFVQSNAVKRRKDWFIEPFNDVSIEDDLRRLRDEFKK